jgi:hypothetical protein
MGKYVYAYKGGGMGATEEEQAAQMAAWQAWFGQLGSAIVDGGNPFAGSAEVTASGTDGAASSHLTGYTVVSASSLDDAATKARGCPIFDRGGTVEVYEAIEM